MIRTLASRTDTDEWSLELSLLLKLAASRLSGRQMSQRDHLEPSNVDWNRFVQTADRHRLIPLVCREFGKTQWEDVPAATKQQLENKQRRIALKNCRLLAELRQIVHVFDEAGVPLRPFKGPTLAIEMYGGLGERQFNDLDVMVRPDDLSAALRIFRDAGYVPELTGIDRLKDQRMKQLTCRTNELTLSRSSPNGSTKIDLHWRYTSSTRFFDTVHREVFENDTHCSVANQRIPTIPAEQQIVYLAYHACHHQCMRLSWLCDFGMAIGRIADNDLPSFLATLSSNSQRLVVSALLMLEHLGLVGSLEHRVPNIAQWRQRLNRVITIMSRVVASEDAELLLGAFVNGVWQFQVSGRLSPLISSVCKSALPAEEDLMASGVAGPWRSRGDYVLQKLLSGFLTARPKDGLVGAPNA